MQRAFRTVGFDAHETHEFDTMPDWKTLARTVLCLAHKYSGALAMQEALARARGEQFTTILLFHRVTDLTPEDGVTISTERFRRICQLLASRFRVVPLGEIYRVLHSGEKMPARTVAITFDDCYHDNLAAARVLAEFGLPATFFLPTDYVGTDRTFPWDAGLARMPNLAWDDVREMARMGFEIGSHTASHANLGYVDRDQAREELATSRAVLERELGRPVRWFAYPFGKRNDLRSEFIPLIREAGYEGAVSAFGGRVRSGTDDRVLPREAVPYFKSVAHLEVYLTGCLDWLYALKKGNPNNYAWPPAFRPVSASEAPNTVGVI